ncbi:hypothetical protein AMJ49_05310 [Parcubacteria bacterium DG_74_2]|nr:MAG: hypothetical protein AMJ49_05310 [Parcubacteria bacterium DG_74_2]
MKNLDEAEKLLENAEKLFGNQSVSIKDLDSRKNSGGRKETVERLLKLRNKATSVFQVLGKIREQAVEERIRVERKIKKSSLNN